MSRWKQPNTSDASSGAGEEPRSNGSTKPAEVPLRAGLVQAAGRSYLDSIKLALDKLGIAPEVFDGIPVALNLDAEIRVSRAQQVRYLTMLSEGIHWLYSDPLTQEQRPLDDGEVTLLKGSRHVLSVEQLLSQSLALTKTMLQAKADIDPGDSQRNGSVSLRIEVMGPRTESTELPELDQEASDEDEGPTSPDVVVGPKSTNGYD